MSGPMPAGVFARPRYALRHVGRFHRHGEAGAEGLGEREAGREAVGGDELAGAEELCLDQVAESQGANAEHGDGLGKSAAADESEKRLRRLDAMGHRHDLRQHRNVIRQVVRNSEQLRAREQVHVLGPAAEEMGRPAAMQAVAVVLEVLAHVIGIAVAAEMAVAAGDIGGRHDAVAGLERPPLAVEDLAAGRDHLADILVTADQRIGQIPFVRGAGILLALAAEGVLVGAADSGIVHLHDHRAGRGIGHRKFVQCDHAGTLGDGRSNHAHDFALVVAGLPRAPARRRAASLSRPWGPRTDLRARLRWSSPFRQPRGRSDSSCHHGRP